MAWIDFSGKAAAWNQHQAIIPPSLVNLPDKGVGRVGRPLEGNLVIHGDNTAALAVC